MSSRHHYAPGVVDGPHRLSITRRVAAALRHSALALLAYLSGERP